MSHAAKMMVLFNLVLVVLLAGGCQVVNVKDADGKAVAWAKVNTSTAAGGDTHFPAYTDLFGNAMLTASQEPPGTKEYIKVEKEGYAPSMIPRPEDGTVSITLKKTMTPPAEPAK